MSARAESQRCSKKTGFLDGLIENVPADYPPQIQLLAGVDVPDIVEGYQRRIEASDGTVPNVNVVNQLTKDDIADEDFTDFIDFSKGKWVSQDEYATTIPCKVKTLQTYRETRHRPEQSKKFPTIWRDKAGNIYELKSGKSNASPPYFLRNAADSR